MSSNSSENTAVCRCLQENEGSPCAVISDVHGNLPALQAVMADIDSLGIKSVCCLGDVVGYGPHPVECWRILKDYCRLIIRGNHDQALSLEGINRFHPRARTAIEWTLKCIANEADGEDIIRDLTSLPIRFLCRDRLYVHGSPAGPTMDYLLPRDAFDTERMSREFRLVETCAFNGHSHIPGVIEKGGSFILPEGMDNSTYVLGNHSAIINVGSVGQPRDGNPKACYVVIDRDRVRYRRVAYDAAKVCREILAIPALDPFLGHRLVEGR